MPDAVLPAPTRLSPVRDEHTWYFPPTTGHRSRGRLRGLADRRWRPSGDRHRLMLGAGLINTTESYRAAVVAEFGDPVAVVRHFPTWTMTAAHWDQFELIVTLSN